jgi:serine incorporator 1/3
VSGAASFRSVPRLRPLRRWWGPKVLLWIVLVVITFFIPNGFFMFWGNYVSPLGASIFILLGLVLLVDFAHSWSEMCLENWESSSSNLWQWILIGSTAGLYAVAISLTGVLYGFFADSGCTLNRFFITFNLIMCVIITILSVHPTVQEYNPRSGLAQASMVAAYCTYLVMSAVGNYESGQCNPISRHSGTATGTRNTTVVVGAMFTFLAIAYSTSRAATQSKALVGKRKSGVQLPLDDGALEARSELNVVSHQPGRTESPRYQALLAAVEAG